LTPINKYTKHGKPKENAEKVLIGYKIEVSFELNNVEMEKILNRKARFILATNDLDVDGYKDEQILDEYKAQQAVESRFRFLKDPWFMVDSIFLKLPKRIEALMMS
jgi:transposase